jgi:uncharacterized membrane protein (UPF0127 family)
MQIPLDIVWLDPDGRVRAVLDDVPPCRAEPCPLYEPDGTEHSVAVIEQADARPGTGAASHVGTLGTFGALGT